jgi:hypothetical protein
MLVVDAGCSTPGSASPSLLDSPTLARVERARLRQEGSGSAGRVGVGGTSPSHHAACCQVNQHKYVLYMLCTFSACERYAMLPKFKQLNVAGYRTDMDLVTQLYRSN